MEPDRNGQDPEKPEKKEMPSTNSTRSLKREENQQQEDHLCDLEKIIPEKRDIFLCLCNIIDLNSKDYVIKKYFPAQLLQFPPKSTNKSVKNQNVHIIENSLDYVFLHVLPDQNASNLTILPATDIQDFLGADYLDILVQKWSMYSFIKPINLYDRIKIFNKIMTPNKQLSIEAVSAGKFLQSKIDHYDKEYKGKKQNKIKQYAFGFIFFKNGEHLFIAAVPPDFKKHKHSEEILIEIIDKLLQENKSVEIKSIFIYSHNSPCLMRPEDNVTPCMFQLLSKAIQWKSKYGFSTHVVFTEFWGLCGPHFFDVDSSISCHMSNVSSCRNFTTEILTKNGNSCDYETLTSVEARNLKHLNKGIKSALISSSLMTLNQSKFQICESLTNEKRKEIIETLNFASVNFFVADLKSHWGDSCPLQIFQLRSVNKIM